MKVSRKWLQMYFDEKLPLANEMADLFTFHSFEVESVEEVGDDSVLDVKVLPDRASYALCHRGVAREIHATTGLPLKKMDYPHADISLDMTEVDVVVDDSAKDFCKRYTARKVVGIHGKDSPEWAKTYLGSIGARSISAIVDVTNFVMYDIGQPLHAYDADKVVGKITVRRAKEGEEILLLSGTGDLADRKEVTKLTSKDFVIADDEGPLAVAGVKGGSRAGIGEGTKSIIIESANFDRSTVRATSQRLGIRNDSSKRFENGITTDLTKEAMEMASALLKEIFVDAKFGPITDVQVTGDTYDKKGASKKHIPYNPDFICKKLGMKLSEDEIKAILARLDIDIVDGMCIIPNYRLDLEIPEDIVDEVGRIHGYNDLPDTPLAGLGANSRKVNSIFYTIESIKKSLVKAGFSEVSLYTLVKKGDVEVVKPLASDKKALRTNLRDSLQVSLENNIKNAELLSLDDVLMFEIGSTFGDGAEDIHLALATAVVKKTKGKKAIDLAKSNLDQIKMDLEVDWDGLDKLIVTNEISGGSMAVAEVSILSLASEIDKKGLTSYADVLLDINNNARFTDYSTEPFITRDIALFVGQEITPDDVKKVITDARKGDNMGSDIYPPRLVDEFTKDGKKSVAFRMIFQSKDRTLTDDEVNKVMEDKVYKAVAEKGWAVR